MRLTPAVTAAAVLLVLLTWLSFGAIDPDAERYDRALKALDRFTVTEIALHRDVLSARAGMLRNYDPLVRELDDLREALDPLRNTKSGDPEEAAAMDRFAAAANRQEELTEHFKSDNALLQNSLAHFRLFTGRFAALDGTNPLAPAVSSLAAAMLQLTLDTSQETAREVDNHLTELAAQPFPPGAAELAQALLAHGRLLHDLLPPTDVVLRALLAAPSKAELKTLYGMILTRQAGSRATARNLRVALYATSLLLLGLFVKLGLRLRARAVALHRRAAVEHLIAAVSTRLIDAQPHEIDAQITLAVAEMAALIDADRAYFIVSGNPMRMHRWCKEGITFPPNWPDRALALAQHFVTVDGIIQVPSIDRLPGGADKDILAAAGLRGWSCVSKLGKCGGFVILGFDALRPGIITQLPELGLLRMALDAIANAMARAHLEQERAQLESSLQQARRMKRSVLSPAVSRTISTTLSVRSSATPR